MNLREISSQKHFWEMLIRNKHESKRKKKKKKKENPNHQELSPELHTQFALLDDKPSKSSNSMKPKQNWNWCGSSNPRILATKKNSGLPIRLSAMAPPQAAKPHGDRRKKNKGGWQNVTQWPLMGEKCVWFRERKWRFNRQYI